MGRLFFVLGCGFAGLAVAAGAFGAHALRGLLTGEMLAVFETGVRYQMYHALALLIVAWAASAEPVQMPIVLAGWLFIAGILVFSGSLYVLALSGLRWFGALTPLGGLAFLTGWGVLAYGLWRLS